MPGAPAGASQALRAGEALWVGEHGRLSLLSLSVLRSAGAQGLLGWVAKGAEMRCLWSGALQGPWCRGLGAVRRAELVPGCMRGDRADGAEWAHLSCRSRAAVRQGRSSSACNISRAEPASTRAGRRTTNSAVRGGLFQARNCGGGRDTVAQTGQEDTCWPWPRPMTSYCTLTQRHSVRQGSWTQPSRPPHLWLCCEAFTYCC